MKRRLRNILSVVLSAVCIFMLSSPSAVQAKEIPKEKAPVDLYKSEYEETIDEGGQTYHLRYFVNQDGNNAITVQSEYETNQIVRDSHTGTVYLNGRVFSTAKKKTGKPKIRPMVKANNKNWVYFDKFSNKVSWKKGVIVAAVAGAIAIGLGALCTATTVIAAMGYGTLSVIAGASIGGTVSGKVYKLNSNLMQQFRYNWRFTAPTGEKYGPYTSIVGS